ncbi:MAG: hypothetical protein JKY95_10160 [Planctomycetaceae bacterium]|nr:hypothetical protein [Planctomycetaceae bacterium]
MLLMIPCFFPKNAIIVTGTTNYTTVLGAKKGVHVIAPYRRRINQKIARRLPRRDRNYCAVRYRAELTFDWMTHYRRLNTRWEYHTHLFEGFWQLACLFTILKRL